MTQVTEVEFRKAIYGTTYDEDVKYAKSNGWIKEEKPKVKRSMWRHKNGDQMAGIVYFLSDDEHYYFQGKEFLEKVPGTEREMDE